MCTPSKQNMMFSKVHPLLRASPSIMPTLKTTTSTNVSGKNVVGSTTSPPLKKSDLQLDVTRRMSVTATLSPQIVSDPHRISVTPRMPVIYCRMSVTTHGMPVNVSAPLPCSMSVTPVGCQWPLQNVSDPHRMSVTTHRMSLSPCPGNMSVIPCRISMTPTECQWSTQNVSDPCRMSVTTHLMSVSPPPRPLSNVSDHSRMSVTSAGCQWPQKNVSNPLGCQWPPAECQWPHRITEMKVFLENQEILIFCKGFLIILCGKKAVNSQYLSISWFFSPEHFHLWFMYDFEIRWRR